MSVASVVNAAGNIYDTLFDLSPKEFYSTRDFYNFIKKRLNAPMAVKHFTIVPKLLIFSMDGAVSPVWEKIFTDTHLAKFSILTQTVEIPKSIGAAVVTQQSNSTDIIDVNGHYRASPHIYNGVTQHTFTISFLLTASPIILTFIVPWYYLTLRTSNYKYTAKKSDNKITELKNEMIQKMTNTANSMLANMNITRYKFGKDKGEGTKYISQYPIPKLTIDIKYYRMDLIAGLLFMMNPNFVYRLTGVYPIQFNAPTTAHDTNYNIAARQVTFAFNNIICIPNATYLEMLFNGTHSAFAYKTQSPVQILNALNSGFQDVSSIANTIKGI